MLADFAPSATVAVKNLDKVRPFYEGVLGLKPIDTAMRGAQGFRAGDAILVIYESQFAGTNQATTVTWSLGDRFDAVMDDLRAKGVAFEEYRFAGVTIENGVHISSGGGPGRVAWFKDPDGNIHNLNNG